MKRALILLNPSAGTGKAGLNALKIINRFALEGYEPIVFPIIPSHGLVSEKILPNYEGKTDLVFCSGGDGTLNHVVQGVMEMRERPVLAYIPTGSTNDFARGLNIPFEFEKALDTVFTGNLFRYDVGKFNDRYFNYVAAFGAFSDISYATDQNLKNIFGHAAYIFNAIGELTNNLQTKYRLRIETDDYAEEGDYLFGAVCSAISIGGFSLFRESDVKLNDGKMELLLIKVPDNPAELPNIANALLRGTFDHPCISFRQVSSVRLHAENSIPWSLDGEYGGTWQDAAIEVQQEAIGIMCNRD